MAKMYSLRLTADDWIIILKALADRYSLNMDKAERRENLQQADILIARAKDAGRVRGDILDDLGSDLFSIPGVDIVDD